MRSGGGGYEVVVAVDIEVAGELLAARTTFFSWVPVSSQRSTCRTKKVGSVRLLESYQPRTGTRGRYIRYILCWNFSPGFEVGDDKPNAGRRCDWSSIL